MVREGYTPPANCPVCEKPMTKGINWYDIGEPRLIVWYCVNPQCSHGSKNKPARATIRISGSHCG